MARQYIFVLDVGLPTIELEGHALFSSPQGPPTFEEILEIGRREGVEFTELESDEKTK